MCGEDIDFTNLSHNADYVEWDMGDGTTSTAFNVTPLLRYPGFYDVKLKAFGAKRGVNTSSFIMEVIGSELKVIVSSGPLWVSLMDIHGGSQRDSVSFAGGLAE